MRIAITGASGTIGRALTARLRAAGHAVAPLVRSRDRANDGAVYWSPETGEIDAAALEGVDAGVHLAGENLAEGRWTEARRERILKSRSEGTRLFASALAGLAKKPRVLVSAGGISYYGYELGDERVDESAPMGGGFLAEVCKQWEAATAPAAGAGIRVVIARTGPVVSASGMVEKLLQPMRLYAGGKLGTGKQWVSWIALDDAVSFFVRALDDEAMRGTYNLVSPSPVRNEDFVRTLGRVVRRPAWAPVPAAVVRAAVGADMANETALASQRVEPRRLKELGFEWRYPDLESALRHALGRSS